MLSKPGRMVLLSAFAFAAFIVGPAAWGPFGILLLVGAIATATERVAVAIRRLA